MATAPACGALAWNALIEVTGDTKEELMKQGFTDAYAIRLEAEGYTAAALLKAATHECLEKLGLEHEHAGCVCSKAATAAQPPATPPGVPATPDDGPAAEQPGSSPHHDHDQGQQAVHSSAPGGQGEGEGQPPAKRPKTQAHADQGKPGAAADIPDTLPAPTSTHKEHVEMEVGSSTSHANPAAVPFDPAPPTCDNNTPLQLPVCSFASVGITGGVIDSTSYGKVLEGKVGDVPAVVKYFDPRFEGSEEAMLHEWRVYEHLGSRGAQGVCVPRLLKVGELVHIGAAFLALSDEGERLPYKGPLGAEDREAARAAVRGLHAAGVLHGDIRRDNFVRGKGGEVKLVDFECATILPLERSNQSREEKQKAAELAAVDVM